MRLTTLIFVLILCCGCEKKPATPVKMGLWEVTMRKEAACSPEVAAQIRNYGLSQEWGSEYINCPGKPMDPTTIVRGHACFTESTWEQKKQHLATAPAPETCIYTKPFSEDAHGASRTVECNAAGMTLTLDNIAAWPDREHMQWVTKSTVKFRNVEGTSVVKTEINESFLTSDCGSVRPGESVVIK